MIQDKFGAVQESPEYISQRLAVLSSRSRYAAISFQESRRSWAVGEEGAGVSGLPIRRTEAVTTNCNGRPVGIATSKRDSGY